MPKSPSHTAFTPIWKRDGERFKAWLAIGSGWREADGAISGKIDSLPIDPEENFTGYFRFVEIGTPPPPPLTITRDEFLCSLCDPASLVEVA